MADNIAITAGSGTTYGADEVTDGTLGAVKVGFSKIMDGTLDGTNKAAVTSGGALKVDLVSTTANSTAVKVDGSAATQPVSGTVTAISGTATNLKAEVTGATSGSGTATGAIRVELPSNGTGVVGLNAGSNVIGAITNIIPGTGNTNLGAAVDAAKGSTKSGVLAIGVRDDALSTLTPVDDDYVEGIRVDSTGAQWTRVTSIDSALPAGTNAIGKLAANSGVDIGDVDVTTLPVAFNAGASSATTQRVVAATDSPEVTNTATTATNTTWSSADSYPQYFSTDLGGLPPATDTFGALVTRGAITTDEGASRAQFTGTDPATTIGTCTFTNDSPLVTGTGFTTIDLKFLDLVKLNADANTAWGVVLRVLSDTELYLAEAYTGTGGTGASSRSPIGFVTGTGQTTTVASGVCTMALGTTASASSYIYKAGINGSFMTQSSFSISQRIANQDIYYGSMSDIRSTIKQFARFKFTGTSNTVVVCETGYNPTTTPSASETESTSVTLPGGLTTASALTYKVEQQYEQVIFTINEVVVAQHSKRIPRVMALQSPGFPVAIWGLNGTTPASGTSIVVDYILTKGYDRLDTYQANPTIDGGDDTYFIDVLTTQVQVMSNKGRLKGITAINLNSSPAYVQVFDTTSSVTLGTTVPRYVFPIPANSTAANGAGTNLVFDDGLNVSSGIRIACTTGAKNSTTVTTGISGTLMYRNL